MFLKVVSLDVVCNELSDGTRYVGVYEFINEFMYICRFAVSYVLLMANATVKVLAGSGFWSKPVSTVLFMLCNYVSVEWFLL